MQLKDLQAYEILEKRPSKISIPRESFSGHKKSGARIAVISNDDDNKVFLYRFPHAAGGFYRSGTYH